MNEFNTAAGFKINIQKSVSFIYTNGLSERENKKIPFKFNIKKNKRPRSKFNEGEEMEGKGQEWERQ